MSRTFIGSNYSARDLIKESEETRRVGSKVIDLLKRQWDSVVNCTVDTVTWFS